MRIVLVDDHALFREALGALLVHKDPSVRIAGEASAAREGVKVVLEAAPDVVIMDILLGGQNGFAALRELRRLHAPCGILMLTAVVEPGFVVDALSAGADGYALKEQGIDELLIALQRVARRASYVAPRMEKMLGDGEHRLRSAKLQGLIASLSGREREVFALIVSGLTNPRISSELFISVKTVETHRMRINKKLRVHSTVELVRLAALYGLVSA